MQDDSNSPAYTRALIDSPPTLNSLPPTISSTIDHLNLIPHPEGGYFAETDRDKRTVPNPFIDLPPLPNATAQSSSDVRDASTTIYYYLTPDRPLGRFHRNRARTVHTLHWGRGRYVLIHADQADAGGRARVETFTVGTDVAAGEKVQWIVEGGKFKSSFLLPDARDGSAKGLLISETVVPGFDFADHDFLTGEGFVDLIGHDVDAVRELKWLLRPEEVGKLETSFKS